MAKFVKNEKGYEKSFEADWKSVKSGLKKVRASQGDRKMTFPSDKEINAVRAKLDKAEPSRLLPKNASKADHLKFKIREKFVVYLRNREMTQASLARKLKVDPARINEIVKYRIDLYTVDKLLYFAERLHLDFEVEVVSSKQSMKSSKQFRFDKARRASKKETEKFRKAT